MPAKAPPTPAELAERIGKLPAWARDHIRTREELVRKLAAQLQSAGQAAPQAPSPVAVAAYAQAGPVTAACSADHQRAVEFARTYSEMTGGTGGIPDPSLLAATLRPEAMGQAPQPSVWTPAGTARAIGAAHPAPSGRPEDPPQLPAGIRLAPDGDHVTDAVYPRQLHVWYGPHSATDGGEALIVESGGVPLLIRPVGRNEIVITRG